MMRLAAASALMIAVGATATAADTCYRREYSAAHLAAQPNQSVTMVELRLFEADGERLAEVIARFRDSLDPYGQTLHCWKPDPTEDLPVDAIGCSVDCDGGWFHAWATENDSISIITQGFVVEGGCDAGALAETRWLRDEGAAKTVFKLYWVPLESCGAR